MLKEKPIIIIFILTIIILLSLSKNRTSFETTFLKGKTSCKFYEITKSEIIDGFGFCSCNNIVMFEYEINQEKLNSYKNFLILNNLYELANIIEKTESSLINNDYNSYIQNLKKYENSLKTVSKTQEIMINEWFINNS